MRFTYAFDIHSSCQARVFYTLISLLAYLSRSYREIILAKRSQDIQALKSSNFVSCRVKVVHNELPHLLSPNKMPPKGSVEGIYKIIRPGKRVNPDARQCVLRGNIFLRRLYIVKHTPPLPILLTTRF
jgi:flagellar biosynthesis/type III secretory pathway ATPase